MNGIASETALDLDAKDDIYLDTNGQGDIIPFADIVPDTDADYDIGTAAKRVRVFHGVTSHVEVVNFYTNNVLFSQMQVGKLGGTNGFYHTRNGTNYWITFGTTD